VLPSTIQGKLQGLWPDHDEKMVHNAVDHAIWYSDYKDLLMGNTSQLSYLEHVGTLYNGEPLIMKQTTEEGIFIFTSPALEGIN